MSDISNSELNERVNKDLIQKNMILENKLNAIKDQINVMSSILESDTSYDVLRSALNVLELLASN